MAWTRPSTGLPPTDYLLYVRLGKVPGSAIGGISGHGVVGTAATTVFPAAIPQVIDEPIGDVTMAVASTDANDTSAGTGARTVTFTGISGGVETAETVTLTGQTKAATVNAYSTCHQIVTASAGSGGVNAGTLYVGADSDTFTGGVPDNDVYGAMEAGWNESHTAIYEIPTGKTGYALMLTEGVQTRKISSTRVLHKAAGGLWHVEFEIHGKEGTTQAQVRRNGVYPAGSKIRVDAKVDASTSDISIRYPILLVDD